MGITNKQLILTAAGIIAVFFIYMERVVITPFLLAAVFAYAFNPIVNAFIKHLRVPRVISIIAIYLILFLVLGFLLALIGSQLLNEAKEVTTSGQISDTAAQAINSLPTWTIAGQEIGLRTSAINLLEALKSAASNYQTHAVPFYTGALRQALSVFVFFIAGFYFLRDGTKMKRYLLDLIPEGSHTHFREIWSRVNNIMGNYLRGQLILIALMSTLSFIALEVLGVKYALTLAVLTGFLEIIPYVGPITAASIATLVAYLNGQNRFGLDQITLALIVIAIYFILRHLEDYFVIPQLYHRLTKLHPLVVIFSVLAGGHLFGPIGLVLAVPVSASFKVILEYLTKESLPTPSH